MTSVLIVDDEPAILTMLETGFRAREVFRVSTAGGGEQAIALMASQDFDVVLSDVRMPGIDGHELASWIGRNRPKTRVLLMSGLDADPCEKCPYASGCARLDKPFTAATAIGAVERAMGIARGA